MAVFCLVLSAMSFAQVPQMMSYQAVVRGSDNNLVANQQISMRVSILQGSADGGAVYTETHSAQTNANGLVSIEIGNGTSNDNFSTINWANGPFFVKTETDVNGGENYEIVGVSQLLSVPYAMYAQSAGNMPDVSGFLSEENQNLADVIALGNTANAQIKNVTDPTDAQDAATKAYVDALVAQLQAAMNNIGGGFSPTSCSQPTGSVGGHGYVDLGLPSGILWATCNVGADSPTAYGDYFAWGETTTKENYNWSTYRYCNGSSSTLTKYCNNAEYGDNGFTDELTTLEVSDDAATANWGSAWRMPTQEEYRELLNYCYVIWTKINGVAGRLFIGPNGNSIFLPAAGFRHDSELRNAGSYGLYWSSSLYSSLTSGAWNLYFNSAECYMGNFLTRYYGQSVRAVCQSQN